MAVAGKKGRKIGRNADFCKVYAAENRKVKNKKRKILRHMKTHPEDKQAHESIR
jgi:hypothetical protein